MIDRAAARRSLGGLALGDCFGETWFFRPADQVAWMTAERIVGQGPWRWTDDTAMALPLYEMLLARGEVDRDDLAHRFAAAYAEDPHRNYGAGMHDVLRAIGAGEPWPDVTRRQFDGHGSWGNGAAMRVAPLGAALAADLDRVVDQANLSATVTHAHPEAAAGAVAVALAAACSARAMPADRLLAEVIARTPAGEVAARLRTVADLGFTADPGRVAGEVGCGAKISAPDTVPYAIWCAARHLDDLTEALWTTVGPGGDLDTTCAIVGGIIAARTGLAGVPEEWLRACEPLPV